MSGNCTGGHHGCGGGGGTRYRKPVIYLYPKESINVKIHFNLNKAKFTTVYPKFTSENEWNVLASPNGDIKIGNKIYPSLFWEAESYINQDFSKGFIVRDEDAESFLEEKLKLIGLNDKESYDFITFWLPLIKRNKLSLLSFQTEEFFKNFEEKIEPKPDTVLRVFLSIKKIEKICDIEEQKLTKVERSGFTVVEWGGSLIDN